MPVEAAMTDEALMGLALELAESAAELGEVPVGAVIVDPEGEVIGRGHNRQLMDSDPTAHAEVIALRDAARTADNYRLPECTMYVTIEPCTMCAGALVHARIRRLVFAAREPRAGAVVSSAQVLANPGLNHQVEVVEGVLAGACSDLMREFFRARR